MIISLIPHDGLDDAWREAAPHIMRATDRSFERYGLYDIFKALKTGHQQLWVVYDDDTVIAAFTTSVTDYPGRRILTCQFCGGAQLTEWSGPATEVLQSYAKQTGCTLVELYGRKGWVRELKKQGWADEFTAFQIEVPDDG